MNKVINQQMNKIIELIDQITDAKIFDGKDVLIEKWYKKVIHPDQVYQWYYYLDHRNKIVIQLMLYDVSIIYCHDKNTKMINLFLSFDENDIYRLKYIVNKVVDNLNERKME